MSYIKLNYPQERTSCVRWASRIKATAVFAVMVLKETIAKVWLPYLTLPFLLLYATQSYVLHNRHPVTSLLL